MLDDFVKDLTETLQRRRAADVAAVIASGDPVQRGKVQTYDIVLRDIELLVESYLEPEEGPPAVQEWKRHEQAGRRFGSRRAS